MPINALANGRMACLSRRGLATPWPPDLIAEPKHDCKISGSLGWNFYQVTFIGSWDEGDEVEL